jgi:MFS family permease
MTSLFIVAYTILLFPTYLQRDLHLSPALVALPVVLQNATIFASSLLWGFVTERLGRRWAMIIPAIRRVCDNAVLGARPLGPDPLRLLCPGSRRQARPR